MEEVQLIEQLFVKVESNLQDAEILQLLITSIATSLPQVPTVSEINRDSMMGTLCSVIERHCGASFAVEALDERRFRIGDADQLARAAGRA